MVNLRNRSQSLLPLGSFQRFKI